LREDRHTGRCRRAKGGAVIANLVGTPRRKRGCRGADILLPVREGWGRTESIRMRRKVCWVGVLMREHGPQAR